MVTSARSDSTIGGSVPSVCLETIVRDGGPGTAGLDRYLKSYHTRPEHRRAGTFDDFFSARGRELLAILERATGFVLSQAVESDAAGEGDEADLRTPLRRHGRFALLPGL